MNIKNISGSITSSKLSHRKYKDPKLVSAGDMLVLAQNVLKATPGEMVDLDGDVNKVLNRYFGEILNDPNSQTQLDQIREKLKAEVERIIPSKRHLIFSVEDIYSAVQIELAKLDKQSVKKIPVKIAISTVFSTLSALKIPEIINAFTKAPSLDNNFIDQILKVFFQYWETLGVLFIFGANSVINILRQLIFKHSAVKSVNQLMRRFTGDDNYSCMLKAIENLDTKPYVRYSLLKLMMASLRKALREYKKRQKSIDQYFQTIRKMKSEKRIMHYIDRLQLLFTKAQEELKFIENKGIKELWMIYLEQQKNYCLDKIDHLTKLNDSTIIANTADAQEYNPIIVFLKFIAQIFSQEPSEKAVSGKS